MNRLLVGTLALSMLGAPLALAQPDGGAPAATPPYQNNGPAAGPGDQNNGQPGAADQNRLAGPPAPSASQGQTTAAPYPYGPRPNPNDATGGGYQAATPGAAGGYNERTDYGRGDDYRPSTYSSSHRRRVCVWRHHHRVCHWR